jgi:pyruvate dehydrogenase E2 component (dihydrolipoamide acetyltransferase)
MKIFKLPDLGEGLQEAEIVEWRVGVGDEVEADQPMVSVETAKAVVEIPAPYAGRIARLFGKPGEVAHLGAPLVGFEGEDGAAQAATVVGRVESTGQVLTGHGLAPAAGTGAGIKAMPAVRALARKLGVDLAMVTPTGADGLITAADVERAAKELAGLGPREALRGVRRAMAQSMALAHAEAAAVTVVDDADIEAWDAGSRILPRLVRALIAGVRAEPGLNAWYDGKAIGRHVIEKIDLGVAVDSPDGLFVPVLRDVAALAAERLDAALAALVEATQARRVPPEDLRGATITLSNFGAIAGRYASPVVVPPTVAILGAGRVRDEVVARGRQPVVRRILPLSLSFDHRCVTGGEAARFLAAVISDLERAK